MGLSLVQLVGRIGVLTVTRAESVDVVIRIQFRLAWPPTTDTVISIYQPVVCPDGGPHQRLVTSPHRFVHPH